MDLISQVFLCIYLLASGLSLLLNCLVLIAVFRYRRLLLKKRFAILISLAVADFLKLVPLLAQIIAVTYGPKDANGTSACLISSSVGLLFIALTAFHLASESINRLISIIWPLRYEQFINSKMFLLIITSVWVLPIIGIIIPPHALFGPTYDAYHALRMKMYSCSLEDLDDHHPGAVDSYIGYAGFVTVFYFIIPFLIMGVSYSIIFKISLNHISEIKHIEAQMAKFRNDRESISEEVASIASLYSNQSRASSYNLKSTTLQAPPRGRPAGEDNDSSLEVSDVVNENEVGNTEFPLKNRELICIKTSSSSQELNNSNAGNGNEAMPVHVHLQPDTVISNGEYGKSHALCCDGEKCKKAEEHSLQKSSLGHKEVAKNIIKKDEQCKIISNANFETSCDYSGAKSPENALTLEDQILENSVIVEDARRKCDKPKIVISFVDDDDDEPEPYEFIKEFSVMAAWAETLRIRAQEEDIHFSWSNVQRMIRVELRKRKREIRLARTLGVLVGAFLLFYLPMLIFAWTNMTEDSQPTKFSFDLGRGLVAWAFLNSALNPLIYCLRIIEIKRSVNKVLKSLRQSLKCL